MANSPKDAKPETAPAAVAAPANPKVKWNVEQLKSSYVNFANANSTQEEVVLNFGMNNNWDHGTTMKLSRTTRKGLPNAPWPRNRRPYF